MHVKPVKPLTFLVLTLLIVGSIDSIRNLPAIAIFGESLIFFFALGALTFLLPTALLSAELASTWVEGGGIYYWVSKAFGDHLGALAIWLQWINTVVWIPTILSFIASTLAYLLSPSLANNPYYLVGAILVLLWLMTFINAQGIRISSLLAAACAILGVFLPMLALVGLGLLWLLSGKNLALHLSWHGILPQFTHWDSWVSLTAVMTSFLGAELATVNIRDVQNPQRTFPKALITAVVFIFLTMILGSLAIAIMIPADEIGLMNGTMEALNAFFSHYHLSFLMPIAVFMIFLGAYGELVNWTTSPARGLAQTIDNGYLPTFLKSRHRLIPYRRILILQSVLASIISGLFVFLPKINGSYWLLTVLSTEVYMVMYVLFYAAGIRLAYKFPHDKGRFRLPGGLWGRWVICGLGLIGAGVTLVIGFFPPVETALSLRHYSMYFTLGLLAMILPVLLMYAYKGRMVND